jgi:riboflavin kinase/FMN adenylyltransferase
MDVVPGIDALARDHGPAFVVVGVFDGLHLGHRYLLDHLVVEADRRQAKPVVVTFDHHPDEVLTGSAPPLLLDPEERLERLATAGVEVTVVQHFDAALRQTPYDVFVERIRARLALTGFLMTPDAAFGFERRGTPETLAALGARDGFDVVVVPPFDLDGRPVRSTEIRTAIAGGHLRLASALLAPDRAAPGWHLSRPDRRDRHLARDPVGRDDDPPAGAIAPGDARAAGRMRRPS